MRVREAVQVWPDEIDGGYGAEIVEFPGVVSQGETEEEAVRNVADALYEIVAYYEIDCDHDRCTVKDPGDA